jgi:benzylsuccinate CoA-transferase BbsF subunit
MLAQSFMDYALNGRAHERLGNRSIFGNAPAGVYPCRSAGPVEACGDRWISIEVTSDDEWRALVREMGSPAWALDEALATNEGRLEAHDAIDAGIAAWTCEHEDYDLFHRLQRAGVPAAPVLEVSRIFDDEHVVARKLHQKQRLFDDVGEWRFNTPFYRMPRTPITVRQPPVALGEHNEYVYREVARVSDDEFERYCAGGHVSMDFDASVP